MTYALEPGLTPEEFLDLLRRSTLAERRPVDEFETILATAKAAAKGVFEKFKTGVQFDGTATHPEWLG